MSFVRIKNTILLIIGMLGLALFLFAPLFSKTNNALDLSAPVNGLRMIALIFSGFKFIYNNPDIGGIEVNVPAVPCILMLAGLIPVLICVGSAIYGFVKQRDNKRTSFIPLSAAAYFLIVYAVLILGGGSAEDFGAPVPQTVSFYQTYSVSVSVLILAMVFGLQAGLNFGINKGNFDLVKRYSSLYIMVLLPLLFILLFCLYPILLQIICAFKDYTLAGGVWNSKWIGLKNFGIIFTNPDMLYILWNTVFISLIKIALSIVLPLILAIFLFDMPFNRYRKAVQTLIYIPHFFSWVVIYAISYAFMNPSGIINKMIEMWFGGKPVLFLESGKWFIPIQIITFVWKETGWNTIIYFAALMSIDMSLYEAAKIDGAGPVKRLFKITLPGIMPIVVFMTILSLGNVLKSAGGEQVLLFYNLAVMKEATVIDTWLYFKGMINTEYGLGSAMLFFQSLFGIVLVVLCNKLSKRVTDRSIW